MAANSKVGVSIEVSGLREMQARLRAADKAFPREIRITLNEITNVILLPRVRAKMERAFVLPLGNKKPSGKYRSGKLIARTRAVSQQRAGIVIEGSALQPYAGWWEFGGSTHSSRGFTDRPFINEGRTLYPALAESKPEIKIAVERMMNKLADMVN